MADAWGWKEVRLFVRFMVYSITAFSAVAGLWITLDLPQVASKEYVNGKFKIATENSQLLQSQLTSTRIMLNKMSRQNLETEKYRLTEQRKTDNSFSLQQRLLEIEEELRDVARERDILLKP